MFLLAAAIADCMLCSHAAGLLLLGPSSCLPDEILGSLLPALPLTCQPP